MDRTTIFKMLEQKAGKGLRVNIRRFIRKATFLPLRAAIGQMIRDKRRRKIELFISSAHELSAALKDIAIYRECPTITKEVANFEFLIPAKSSHIEFLNKNLVNLADKYGDSIKVNVLVNETSVEHIRVPKLLEKRTNIVTESIFKLELHDLQKHIGRFNENRWSWFRQQCLKTLFVASSSNPIVILDADTLLVKPINFQPDGKNLLLMGSDVHSHFHAPYSVHLRKYLKINPLPINFTQHCQLQIPRYVNEIYTNDVLKGLSAWLDAGRSPFEFSPVCEYQTYAEYVRKYHSENTVFYSHTHHLARLHENGMSKDGLDLLSVDDHLMNCSMGKCDLVTMLA